MFFFPPLFLFTLPFARRVEVCVPLCRAHEDDFARCERAEKRYVFPAWTAVAVLMDLILIVECLNGGPAISGVGLFAVPGAAIIAVAVIGRGRIALSKPRKTGVRLTGVHPAFVAALVTDRARDRVSNPDRRTGHGDVRDDYDDQAD